MDLLGCFLWDPLEEWGELRVGEEEREKEKKIEKERRGRGGGELERIMGDIYTQLLGVWVGGREKGGMEEIVREVRDTFWSLGGVLGKVLKEMEGEKKEKEEKNELEKERKEKEGEVRKWERGFKGKVGGYKGEWEGWGEGWKEKKGVRGMLEQALEQCDLWERGFEGVFSFLFSLPPSFSSFSSFSLGGGKREELFLTLGRVVGGEGGRGVFGVEFVDRCRRVERELVGSWEGFWKEIEESFILLARYKGLVEELERGVEKKGGKEEGGEKGGVYMKLNKCREWTLILSQILHQDTILSSSPPPLPPPPPPPSSSSSSSSSPFPDELMVEREEKKLKEGVKVLEGMIEKGKEKEFENWLGGVVEEREGRGKREGEKERKYMKIVELSRSFCDNILYVSCLRKILEREEQRGREAGRRGEEIEREFWEFIGLFFFFFFFSFLFFS